MFQRIFGFFTFVVVDNVLSFDVIDKFDKFGIIYLIVSNICNGRKERLQYEGKKEFSKPLEINKERNNKNPLKKRKGYLKSFRI